LVALLVGLGGCVVSENVDSKLRSLYNEVLAHGQLGTNSIHRRTLSAIKKAIQTEGTSRPSKLDFDAVYGEIRADDRRRSIFLNPTESLAAQLIDLYTGRLESLEFRTDDSTALATAKEIAQEYVRRNHPIISIRRVAGRPNKEIIDALLAAAHFLKNSESEANQVNIRQSKILGVDAPSEQNGFDPECSNVGTDRADTQWEQDDVYYYLYQYCRAVLLCSYIDPDCSNYDQYFSYGPWQWEEIWEDTGPNNPPPILPPAFIPVPWNNRLPLVRAPNSFLITSHYGWRTLNGALDFHPGVDVGAPAGTEVYSIDTGEVVWVHPDDPTGETGVIVRIGVGATYWIEQYWHLVPASDIKIGFKVPVGYLLGTVSPHYPAVHLHFAKYNVPSGNWKLKSIYNSMDPLP
jgi:hypothetical protein